MKKLLVSTLLLGAFITFAADDGELKRLANMREALQTKTIEESRLWESAKSLWFKTSLEWKSPSTSGKNTGDFHEKQVSKTFTHFGGSF